MQRKSGQKVFLVVQDRFWILTDENTTTEVLQSLDKSGKRLSVQVVGRLIQTDLLIKET